MDSKNYPEIHRFEQPKAFWIAIGAVAVLLLMNLVSIVSLKSSISDLKINSKKGSAIQEKPAPASTGAELSFFPLNAPKSDYAGDLNTDIVKKVIWLETKNGTSEFEIGLITECILYKYWLHSKGKKFGFETYFNKYKGHFQGIKNVDAWSSFEAYRHKNELKGYQKDAVFRFYKISKVVDNRIRNGAVRFIRYYHTTKVPKGFKVGNKRSKLNINHIVNVWERVGKGELEYVQHQSLIHDFFEERHPKQEKEYRKFRQFLKKSH